MLVLRNAMNKREHEFTAVLIFNKNVFDRVSFGNVSDLVFTSDKGNDQCIKVSGFKYEDNSDYKPGELQKIDCSHVYTIWFQKMWSPCIKLNNITFNLMHYTKEQFIKILWDMNLDVRS